MLGSLKASIKRVITEMMNMYFLKLPKTDIKQLFIY